MRSAAAVVVAVLAGCGTTPEQSGAERAVASRAGADARCTSRSQVWFREGPPAEVFVCVAEREHGLCDRYRVDRTRARYRVTVLARASDCALPVG